MPLTKPDPELPDTCQSHDPPPPRAKQTQPLANADAASPPPPPAPRANTQHILAQRRQGAPAAGPRCGQCVPWTEPPLPIRFPAPAAPGPGWLAGRSLSGQAVFCTVMPLARGCPPRPERDLPVHTIRQVRSPAAPPPRRDPSAPFVSPPPGSLRAHRPPTALPPLSSARKRRQPLGAEREARSPARCPQPRPGKCRAPREARRAPPVARTVAWPGRAPKSRPSRVSADADAGRSEDSPQGREEKGRLGRSPAEPRGREGARAGGGAACPRSYAAHRVARVRKPAQSSRRNSTSLTPA